jgi:hypothetical protein
VSLYFPDPLPLEHIPEEKHFITSTGHEFIISREDSQIKYFSIVASIK